MNGNEFVKILNKDTMFHYINDSVGSNILESSLITLTIVFVIWTIKLALEKE